MTQKFKYIIGIDEVGRGPLAGPVTIGAVCALANLSALDVGCLNEHPVIPMNRDTTSLKRGFFDITEPDLLEGIRDSKKLTQKKREVWSEFILGCHHFSCATVSVPANIIDDIGISGAIKFAVEKAIEKIEKKLEDLKTDNTFICLDGSLKAPEKYLQKAIIGGDDIVPIISAASVVAKVSRDKLMTRIAENYPEYGFEKHKGYGTKAHFEAIQKNGMCEIHRRSFLKGL